jgi:gamma-glutamyl-gamma-aminobutyrate hydrolase PuuD
MFEGHTLLPIPNNIKHFNTNIIKQADLVVFSGGNSMFPDSWQYNPNRLAVEKHILDIACRYNKKILGISRGTQFLTVSFGGSLSKSTLHTDDHVVNYYNNKVTVCSRHEEILSSIPPGASIIATDDEGYCESWRLANIATVLWHPERMDDNWLPQEVKQAVGL